MILDDDVTVKVLDLDVDKLTVAIALIMMPNGKQTIRMPSRDGDRGNISNKSIYKLILIDDTL